MRTQKFTGSPRHQLRRLLPLELVAAILAALCSASAAGRQSASEGARRLTRAASAPARVSYVAQETLITREGENVRVQEVRVLHRAPDNTRWEYLDRQGNIERVVGDDGRTRWQYLPSQDVVVYSPSVPADRELWGGEHLELLLRNYDVRVGSTEAANGRQVRRLEITPKMGHRGPRKRLWADEETGLISQSEVTSADRATQLRSTLSKISLAEQVPRHQFRPPANVANQRAIYEHTAVLPLGPLARQWGHTLLVPSSLPNGYLLESARMVERQNHSYVYLRYFDGMNALSLFESPAHQGRSSEESPRAEKVHGSAVKWQRRGLFWVASWQELGLRLTLTGDLPQDEMLRVARGLRKAS